MVDSIMRQAEEHLERLARAHAELGRGVAGLDVPVPARDDARVMIGWGVTALKRNDPEVALGRLQRAAELLGDRPRPATWYWAMALAVAGCAVPGVRITEPGCVAKSWPGFWASWDGIVPAGQ